MVTVSPLCAVRSTVTWPLWGAQLLVEFVLTSSDDDQAEPAAPASKPGSRNNSCAEVDAGGGATGTVPLNSIFKIGCNSIPLGVPPVPCAIASKKPTPV